MAGSMRAGRTSAATGGGGIAGSAGRHRPRSRRALTLLVLVAAVLAGARLEAQGPGGSGPIRVLLVTKGHAFDRAPFFAMFDSLGSTITWTHVEQPAAQEFWDPELAAKYDVFVYFDAMGRTALRRPDGTTYFEAPAEEAQDDLEELLEEGKGMVFFHHSIAAWNQAWPEYAEIVGGACDWGNRVRLRGREYPYSGAQVNIQQHVTVVDPAHPVVRGLEGGFDIVDEAYLCPYLDDTFTPLLRTDFVPIPENFPSRLNRDEAYLAQSNFRNHPPGSNVTAWVKAAENSPVVYLQHGHDSRAWQNPAFLRLMRNAIEWAASDEAKAWAKANPQDIF